MFDRSTSLLFAITFTVGWCFAVSNVWEGEGGLLALFMLVCATGVLVSLFFLGDE
jgi:hypothetical protein